MTTGNIESPAASSPYATGGGGTVLEHRYGAILLADLLVGDPVPGLGDDAFPISVRFQASAFSPVDDLLVVGRTPDDGERRLSIGVRRAPTLVTSDEKSARLLASYVRVITDRWGDVQAGRWRLGLAVVSPNAAVRELRELSGIARGTTDEAGFRTEVGLPGRTSGDVRNRLVHVDALVRAGISEAGIESDVATGVLTWRLLSALSVFELRLEGVDQTDRTIAVARLRAVTGDGTTAAADQLFSRLAELATRYAPAGADVTEWLLRRDLSGTRLARSPSRARAWEVLDGLAERLRGRTGFRLADAQAELEFERAEARKALAAEMTAAASGPAALVVVGEPDVGKSALTLRVAEQMARAGAAVTTLSLHDLPASTAELEALLGGRLADVLGGTAIDLARLLLIDGAEAVLEGRGPQLTEVATAAMRAGLGVVAVTRSDGAWVVAEVLRQATAAAGGTGLPREHEVPRLTRAEAIKLAETFASLTRLGDDPRAAWLLGRPGLIDLLLRAGAVLDLPQGPLSEADVFATIWGHLVCRGEVTVPGGPSPDARERALVSLARLQLLPGRPSEAPDANALPSLRSDGLLLPAGPTRAWNPRDQFASDLVRDLAVARLLITDGWGVLSEAPDPRWALRAVRLTCQARLAAAGADTENVRVGLQAAFDDLAAQHGARWAEVPLEAMLTLGPAREALTRAWPALLANERTGLRTLLRLALQRYSEHGFGDAVVLAPLVELAYCGDDDLGQNDRYGSDDTGKQIRELVLDWLRGLVKTNAGPLVLRQQVRDRILATQPKPYDRFAVEALAMLGPDLEHRAEQFLRSIADDGGAHLSLAVESAGSVLAMSEHQPDLLIALTEAFYIPRPRRGGQGRRRSIDLLDDGIRHHEKAGGFGVPMAAWYLGPFFRLLHTRPAETIALVNRMLDHAAAVRVDHLRRLGVDDGPSDSTLSGLDLDLPGGTRRCVGDPHVWSWYRGSSVGPYPCMSALLAVERFADELVDAPGVPLAKVIEVLLRDCHNLAMPGLVVGLLVRHLDRAGDLLDPWLVRPEVWHLEFARVLGEGRLHVQGADPPELAGRDRRRSSFRDVAAELTLRAKIAEDNDRLAILDAVGNELVRRAREQLAGSEDEGDEIVTVENWAAGLRPENYRVRPADDGRVIVQYEPPQRIASVLAPRLASLDRGNTATRLQVTYARSEDRVAAVDTLVDDLVLARDLAEDALGDGPFNRADAVAAIAAAAVVAHAQGRATVPDDHLRWASGVLVEAAIRPDVDEVSSESAIYPWGADRSAAVGLPALLLPPFERLRLDRGAIEEALHNCARSPFDEVRAAFVLGVAPVWAAACQPTREAGGCRHETAWAAARTGLRDCQLGDWNEVALRRVPEPLDGPYEETLLTVETQRVLVNRLTPPLVAAAHAARSNSCVADAARRLLPALFDAHRRGSDHWAKEGYGDHTDRHRVPVVRVLVETAVAGDAGPLTGYVRLFTSNARALDQLLRDVAAVFTYDETLSSALPTVWRQVMSAAFNAMDAGADPRGDDYWSGRALAGLLPVPRLNMGDADPDRTLERARQNWVAPDEIADLVARWLPLVRRVPEALDAVAQLAQCAPPSWQGTTGLAWAGELIDGDYAAVAGKGWYVVEWLQGLRASRLGADGTARWRRLIDGLAAAGDIRAVRLQQAEE